MRYAKIQLLSIFLLFTIITSANGWEKDKLNQSFIKRSIEMKPDYEGRVVSTLVTLQQKVISQKAILYIHGFNDYFYQWEEAFRFAEKGYVFFAVDLRKYGRSILIHQIKYNFRDISEYYADLDSAIHIIKNEGYTEIYLMGHSTGGLIVANYLNDKKIDKTIKGVILNSPFFDMNNSFITDKIAIPFLALIASISPNTIIKGSKNSVNGESIHNSKKGHWYFDTTLKSIHSADMTLSWIKGIHQAQKSVKQGMNIPLPILVLRSNLSSYYELYNPLVSSSSDTVLDVEDIEKYSKRLGSSVKVVTIQGSIHDVLISEKSVRDRAYKEIFSFLKLHF